MSAFNINVIYNKSINVKMRRGPIKEWIRKQRLAAYHLRHGPGFDYHGATVQLDDWVPFSFKRLLMRGQYEEAERQLIERYLDPSLPVVEFGGSLGVVSAYVGSRINADTPHTIVEANGTIAQTCQRNANASRHDVQSEVITAALAYGTDSVSFDVSENFHISKLASEPGSGNLVPATSLEKVVSQTAPEGDYSLIIDVEGAEFDLFLQEPHMFKRCALAIVEYHPHEFAASGRSEKEFWSLVDKAGMERIENIECTVALKRKAL